MELTAIKVGLKKEAVTLVAEDNTAKTLGSGSLKVFATPAMTCLMEKAAADLLESVLSEDMTSVGISLNIAHKAPTPLGMKVRAEAVITAVDGRKVTFAVKAYDEKEEIGSGIHERFLVAAEKFQSRADNKIIK